LLMMEDDLATAWTTRLSIALLQAIKCSRNSQ